jgi:hypothetical protein
VDVDPGRHHVLQATRQDDHAAALEHAGRVGGCRGEEGLPLAPCSINVLPVAVAPIRVTSLRS